MAEPIPFKVTRYRCPHCPRTASSKARTVEHMGRCWLNPAVRGCKTCRHFLPYGPEWDDDCAAGVDLSGRPACPGCHGTGYAAAFLRAADDGTKCPTCKGDAAEVRPGPIVGCEKWEAADGAEA